MAKRLSQTFFSQDLQDVAHQLLGKIIVHRVANGDYQGFITETEAYGGADDPASHAFLGKTKRNWPMFGEAGLLYVYLIYGMYSCLNVVVGPVGQPAGVLVRSVVLLPDLQKIDGPGRVCRALGISVKDNGMQSTSSQRIWFEDRGIVPTKIQTTPRVGIRKNTEQKWRYLAELSVS